MKLFKISLLISHSLANVEKRILVLTFLLSKPQNDLVPKSSDKLMQLVLLERFIDELKWVNWFAQIPKKLESSVVSWFNSSLHI